MVKILECDIQIYISAGRAQEMFSCNSTAHITELAYAMLLPGHINKVREYRS